MTVTTDHSPHEISALAYCPLNEPQLNAALLLDSLPQPLLSLPSYLWAEHKNDVGLVECPPYEATVKHLNPVYIKQYPLSPTKEEGIDAVLSDMLRQGVVVPCTSPYNTPVNPVLKPDGTWRFTQDLRRINDLIIPVAPVVPDVYSIMSSIPHDHGCFSVVDLCSAFFSIPVGEDTQSLFAFTHRQRQYTWTLPQGYIDSPALFAAAVRDALADLPLPNGSVVLQYADDLLVSAKTHDLCQTATIALLQRLAAKGFKVSKTKLQFCLTSVQYLGHELSQGSKRLTQDRVKVILDTQLPATKHTLQAFLGLINYCRQWIPDCSVHDKCLRSAIVHTDPNTTPLIWTEDMKASFKALKSALCSAPALGLPNYQLPFHLWVTHHGGDTLFVDGSCSKPADGVFLCGYAVCQLPDIVLEAYALPFNSAQAAELYTLTRACILSQDRDVTIFTDSR
ncbi:hypothetical protein MHYP_G00329230 [Metynnis hypsauchen]